MDIQRINYVVEKAISLLQADEVELLSERFKVPTPKAMHKKYGMSLTVDADGAMERTKAALSSLTSGPGKLTDPDRTPERNEVVDALNELIEVSKGMAPRDRKEVLAQLRDWQKTARAHAKRLEQAASSHRVSGLNKKHVVSARDIRDDITGAVAIIKKYKGGGFMKQATKTTAALEKEKAEQEAKAAKQAAKQAERTKLIAQHKQIAKEVEREIRQGPGRVVHDTTVGTFVKILEGLLWQTIRKSHRVEKGSFWDELMTVKRAAKRDWNSDDKRDLQDLLKNMRRTFQPEGQYVGGGGYGSRWHPELLKAVKSFESMLQRTIRTGKPPYVPHEITVKLKKPDKRQMKLAFEELKRLRLALAG